MSTPFKWLARTLIGVAVFLVVSIAVLFVLFDWNWFKDVVVTKASEATGRKISITGDIEGEFSLVPRFSIPGIRIANAEWASAKSENMVAIKSLVFRIELLELLRGRVVLPELSIAGADLSLEKRQDGKANWEFGPSVTGAAAEAAVPDDRTEFPVIGRLEIDDSEVTYIDPTENIKLTVKISNVGAKGGGKQSLRVAGNGLYRKQEFKLAVNAGRLLDLREEGKPYPVDFSLGIGETIVSGQGTALRPLKLDGLDFGVKLAGPNLADLFPIVGIPLPPTASYSLEGRLVRKATIVSFKGLNGRVGKSDMRGDMKVDVGKKPPFMTATLSSKQLDIRDLGGVIGAPPDRKTQTQGSTRILPDMKIELDRLRAMNMRVKFTGENVAATKLPITDVTAELVLQDGKLTLNPLEFGVAGGTISGPLVLDGRKKVPAVETDLTLRKIGLKPFLDKFAMGDLTRGTIGGKLKLAGHGRSLAEVLGTADGRMTVAMVGGTLNPLLVEAVGLDIAQALGIIVAGGKAVRVRCALGDFTAKNGILQIKGFVVDTTDSNIWARGRVNLREERLDVRVHADPKDVSLLSANAPIAVSGTMQDPGIAIDTLGTEGTGGVSEAVGKVVNPILALLPFVDLGLAKDTDCHHFDAGTGKPTPSGQRLKPKR